MFAVPGWSVLASSLVQEQPRSKNADAKQKEQQNSVHSKKRKRHAEYTENEIVDSLHDYNVLPKKSMKVDDGHERSAAALHNTAPTGQQAKHRDRSKSTEISQEGNVVLSQIKRKNDKKKKRRTDASAQAEDQTLPLDNAAQSSQSHHAPAMTEQVSLAPTSKLTPLQAKMRSKLTSARFRHLNETLYTTSSQDALKLFTSSPELFAEYHAGFAQQVKDSWPQNPVVEYIRMVKMRGALSDPAKSVLPLPRRKTGSCTVADLGCGDAPLARGCQSVVKSLKLKFHNYDLHTPNSLVTKADMANLPLRDGEADVVVFCLSLMGTNWIAFVEEAWRILRGDGRGEVWVSEVKSRFGRVTRGRVVENSVGKRRKKVNVKSNVDLEDGYDEPEQFIEDEQGSNEPDDETDVLAFVKVFTRRGFQLRENTINKRNKMFVSMIFTKTGIPTVGKHKGLKWNGKEYQKQHDGKMRFAGGQKGDEETTSEEEAKVLKPCVYKTR